jgi:hypothetical protein
VIVGVNCAPDGRTVVSYNIAFVDGEPLGNGTSSQVAFGVRPEQLQRFNLKDWKKYVEWRDDWNKNKTNVNDQIPSLKELVETHQHTQPPVPGQTASVRMSSAAGGAASARANSSNSSEAEDPAEAGASDQVRANHLGQGVNVRARAARGKRKRKEAAGGKGKEAAGGKGKEAVVISSGDSRDNSGQESGNDSESDSERLKHMRKASLQECNRLLQKLRASETAARGAAASSLQDALDAREECAAAQADAAEACRQYTVELTCRQAENDAQNAVVAKLEGDKTDLRKRIYDLITKLKDNDSGMLRALVSALLRDHGSNLTALQEEFQETINALNANITSEREAREQERRQKQRDQRSLTNAQTEVQNLRKRLRDSETALANLHRHHVRRYVEGINTDASADETGSDHSSDSEASQGGTSAAKRRKFEKQAALARRQSDERDEGRRAARISREIQDAGERAATRPRVGDARSEISQQAQRGDFAAHLQTARANQVIEINDDDDALVEMCRKWNANDDAPEFMQNAFGSNGAASQEQIVSVHPSFGAGAVPAVAVPAVAVPAAPGPADGYARDALGRIVIEDGAERC